MSNHIEQESAENYLEMIHILKDKKPVVRAVDIAKSLNLTRASVSKALQILKEKSYVVVDDDGFIDLTEEGHNIAHRVIEYHSLIVTFLEITAGVDNLVADEDACRLEHVISPETIDAIKLFINSVSKNESLSSPLTSYFPKNGDINESGENYLETIFMLAKYEVDEENLMSALSCIIQDKVKPKNNVHAIDIAKHLNLSRASVSRALNILKSKNFIEIDDKRCIHLTAKGVARSLDIYEKHVFLTNFLVKTLNIPVDLAAKDACRMEHLISDESFKGIKKYLQD